MSLDLMITFLLSESLIYVTYSMLKLFLSNTLPRLLPPHGSADISQLSFIILLIAKSKDL